MASPLERAIRDHVAQYLAGHLSVRELDAWLWPATSNIEDVDDPVARDLTYEIILRLAEYSKGHRTEAELRELLRPIATPAPTAATP